MQDSQMRRELDQFIAADEIEADETRADIGGDDQFDQVIRETVAVGSALIGDLGDSNHS